jgi:serine/threonine protein phosphatase PrpC
MHVLPELFSTFEKATDVDDFIVRIQRVAFFADDKPDDLAQLYEEKDILTRYLNSNEYNHYSPTVTEYVVSENDLAICLFSDGMNNLTTEEMTEILTRDEFEMRKVHAPEAAIVTVNIINHQLIQAAQKKSLTGGHHSKPDDITAAYMLLKNKFTKGSLQ